jgi:hypothetical protein
LQVRLCYGSGYKNAMDIIVIGSFLFATMMFVVSRVVKAIGYGHLEVFVEFAPDWLLIQPSEGSMVDRTSTPPGRMNLVATDGSSAGG